MARLSGQEYKQWVAAFNDAFVARSDLESLVRVALSKELDTIHIGANVGEDIEAVIRAADGQGLLRPLLDEALERQPSRVLLQALSADLAVATTIEPDDAFDATRIWGEPMLDRSDLRKGLKALRSDGAPPVLLVSGERYSGKTWSIRLINYGVAREGDVTHVVVDLEPFEGKPVDAPTLGRLIADRAGFENPPTLNEEQVSQWIRQYFTWLGREAKGAGNKLWIVFDHLQKVVLEQSAKDFLYGLGKEIATSAPMLRLILLSYEDPAGLAVGIGRIEREDVPSLTRDQLKEALAAFFGIEYLARAKNAGVAVDQDDLKLRVAASTQAVLDQILEGDPQRLLQMGGAVRAELMRQ